jgi:hypothetical protein
MMIAVARPECCDGILIALFAVRWVHHSMKRSQKSDNGFALRFSWGAAQQHQGVVPSCLAGFRSGLVCHPLQRSRHIKRLYNNKSKTKIRKQCTGWVLLTTDIGTSGNYQPN